MPQNRDLIILFTKYPSPGRVKTRLIPTLGAQGAASLHAEMTKYVLGWLKVSSKMCNLDLEVWFDGATLNEMKEFLGKKVIYRHQGNGDLGKRMHRAFEHAFARDKERVLIVGSDCPTVRTGTIKEALRLLKQENVVLGPATDGGYYLVGMCSKTHDIFSGIPWSTDKVLKLTTSKIEEAGLSLGLLDEMRDVDNADDLFVFEEAKKILPL